jgi:prevent-host-death family protein
MPYTVHQAKTNFSRLLKEAEAGKEVIVMRGKKPVAKIVAIEEAQNAHTPFRLMGAYRGKIHYDDSALDPLADAELAEFGFDDLLEGELKAQKNKR